jgi:hypothetical protein
VTAYPSLSPNFSRADLAGFLKTISDDSLLLVTVYAAHEEKQREQSRFHLACGPHADPLEDAG